MKQNHKKQSRNKKTISGKQKAFIAALVAGGVLIVLNIIILIISMSPVSYRVDMAFVMHPGDSIDLQDVENKKLKLTAIEDGRCPSDGEINCGWEGQIYYKFSFNGEEFMLGSVREEDRSHILGNDINLEFVSGDLKSGTFILRKSSE